MELYLRVKTLKKNVLGLLAEGMKRVLLQETRLLRTKPASNNTCERVAYFVGVNLYFPSCYILEPISKFHLRSTSVQSD